jgi:Tol biopolymer transport system component
MNGIRKNRTMTCTRFLLVIAFALLLLPKSILAQQRTNGLIAFVRSDSNTDTTYIMNPDGSHLQAVLPGIEGTHAPHWSPDGTQLALLAPLDNPCPPCAASTIIFNPDTGSYRILSPPDPNLGTACSIWSPDASHFACEVGSNDGSRNGIYTIRTSDGLGLTQVTSNPGGDDVPIDYSPDGSQIVFGRVDPNDHHCTTRSAIYVVNVDGSGLHRITPWGFCDDDGGWSPDGTEIAFAHQGSLFVVHPDGTGLAKIPIATGSFNREGDVTWSPDGTKIAFILFVQTAPGTSQEGIGTANADGSNVQLVTSAPPYFDHEADWGPHPLVP